MDLVLKLSDQRGNKAKCSFNCGRTNHLVPKMLRKTIKINPKLSRSEKEAVLRKDEKNKSKLLSAFTIGA
jgi:hypothetical protein